MKFTALAFLTVAFCVSVQARNSAMMKRDHKHGYVNCSKLGHHVYKELHNFEDKLHNVIDDKNLMKTHHDQAEKLMKHAGDVASRVNEFNAVCKGVPNPYQQQAKAECARITGEAEIIKPLNPTNPLFLTATAEVLKLCGMI